MVDLVEFGKFLLTSLITALPSLLLLRKYIADAEKVKSESNQINSDVQNEKMRLLLEAKKTEVEVAERLINATGELIENYKDMITNFTGKFANQEEKLNSITKELHTEVRRREKLERTLKDFIVGIRRLLAQLKEHEIIPVWEPKIDIDIVED